MIAIKTKTQLRYKITLKFEIKKKNLNSKRKALRL